MYKTDNFFRSIKVSYGNSCVTKGFHFFELIWTLDFFCVQNAPFKATSSISTLSDFICYFSCIYWFFELYDPENEKLYKWTLKRFKIGMESSFHPHSMCKKIERVTAKTGCTSCTNWTISFEVSGFRTKTHLLHRLFKILITYYNSRIFLRSDPRFKATSSTFNHFWHHSQLFIHLLICFET